MNKMYWEALDLAWTTKTPHYVVGMGPMLKVVNADNTIFDPDLVRNEQLVLHFAAFPFSDKPKLLREGILQPRA